MTAATDVKTGTQLFRVYIKASPQAIWDAITSPEWTQRYGYGGIAQYDPELKPGAAYRGLTSEAMKEAGRAQGFSVPDVGVDGEIVEVDPPHRLVQTWRMLMDDSMKAEGFTRLTYEIVEGKGGVTKLTVIHELEGKPQLTLLMSGALEETGAGGGWSWILSDLKSLLETGTPMDPEDPLNKS
jgi:uncharacterized protein YndB with AHSA1/START domain